METYDSDTIPAEATDAIPATARTAAYVIGLVVGAIVLTAQGVAPIWFAPDVGEQITATAGVVGGVAAFIAGGLGVAYRPTR